MRKSHGIRSWQVRFKETSGSEPLKRCRNLADGIKTGGDQNPRRSPGGACLLPGRCPAYRRRELEPGSCTERGNLSSRCEGRNPSGRPTRVRVPMRDTGADQPVVATKSRNGDGAKGLDRPAEPTGQPGMGGAGSSKAKPFTISKWKVWEAYKRVKANQGAAGVDGESISEFNKDFKKKN